MACSGSVMEKAIDYRAGSHVVEISKDSVFVSGHAD